MQDLYALNSSAAKRGIMPSVPPHCALSIISTSLRPKAWATLLESHPDADFVACILLSLQDGFCIGFNGASSYPTHRRVRNMRSAYKQPEVVDSYLTKESNLQRILPISSPSTFPQL